ncbi:MAG: CDP-alcohol phosphatidyltransferase family protein [Actinobacteria bacterium]|nr:CDP-alcohol phosphatidyltransferase family protein [Actinomycetota bacterium]
MEVQSTEVQTDRVVTVPNILSALRLLGVPLFLWLILVPEADWLAILVLAIAGFTDWLDGYLARKWHQISRVGQLLDPVADRLYILATLIGLLLRGIVPLWFVLLLVSRDLIMSVVLAVLKRRGVTGLPVHFVGKAATFCLLYAFPLLLLGDGAGWLADTAKVVGWAFAVWGTALYWWAAVLYIGQARRIMAATP